MYTKIIYRWLLVSVFALFSNWVSGQGSYVYNGPLPCLDASTGFVNANLDITGAPAGYTAAWVITSPVSGTVINSSQTGSIGVQFNEVGCWSIVLSINGTVVQNDPCGVEVFQSPIAVVDPVNLTGCTTFFPQANDMSVPGTGTIDTWVWNIAFCNSVNSQNVDGQCGIDVAGTYDITLSVIDDNGCFNNQTYPDVIIVSDSPPNASFDASSLYDCNSPVAIDFVNTSTTANPDLNYQWTVDGLDVATSEDLNYIFNGIGNYDVCLTVTDVLGCTDTFCETVEIFDTPLPDFSIDPAVICAGMTVAFQNQSAPQPIPTIAWDLNGDGTTDATSNTVEYDYPTPGNYNVELYIEYSSHCKDSISQTVVVSPPIDALFDVDTTWSCSAPFTVEITDQSAATGSLTYNWFVLDATGVQSPITLSGNSYTFTDYGTYQIGLTLFNDIGCFDQFIFPEEIIIREPEVEFNLLSPSNCVGDVITTNIYYMQSLQPFVNWYWDVNCDGSVDQQVIGNIDGNTTFTFDAAGTYDICLTAESADGCIDTWQSSVVIAPEIFSGFTVSDSNPCGIDTIVFSATNPDPAISYEWVTGDGNTSGLGPFSDYLYSYCDTGFFDVTLNVSNAGCFTSATIEDFVFVPVPIADFVIQTNCEDYYTVSFTNLSIDPDTVSIVWTIDGVDMYVGEWEPSHTFATEGMHEVGLYVYNDSTGCADYKNYTVKINEPTFDVTIGPTTGCPPVIVNIVPQDVECVSYWHVDLQGTDYLEAVPGFSQPWDMEWDVNEEVGSDSGDNIVWPAVVYNQLGNFDISMTIIDVNGCQIDTTYSEIITVDIDPYFAQFDTVVTRYCDSTVVCATPELPNLENFQWQTNTGLSDNGSTACFTFYPPYNQSVGSIITLSATLPGGCGSTVSDSLFFAPVTTACGSISDDTPCKNEVVFLNADCSFCGAGTCSFAWDLNDDGIFDEASTDTTSVAWAENGDYVVHLQITDSLGCSSVWDGSITVHSPEIEMQLDESVIACISYIQVQNLTTGPGIETNWELSGFDDDGAIDPFIDTTPANQVQAISFNQNTLGIYNIYVEVVNQFGCASDSLMEDLLGYGGALGDFTCVPDSMACAPFSMHCQAFNPNDNSLNYTWNMGDNTGFATTVVDHEYTSPGTYQVSLTITDPDNDCTFSLLGDSITVTQLSFDFLGPDIICPGDSSLISVPGLDSLLWISPLDSISPAGMDQYFLQVNGATDFIAMGYLDGCASEQVLTIDNYILQPSVVEDYGPFCANAGVIDFPTVAPDGGDFYYQNTLLSTISSDLFSSGNDTLVYAFQDDNGCFNSTEIPFEINDTTNITWGSADICVDAPPFDLSMLASDLPAMFSVDYGMGMQAETIFDPAMIGIFSGATTAYDVQYVYVNTDDCVSTWNGSVDVHPLPQVNFTIDDICVGDSLDITQLTTLVGDTIASYDWVFGSIATSTEAEPTGVVVSQDGSIATTLTVTSNIGCSAMALDSISVQAQPILTAEPYAPVCANTGAIALPVVNPTGGVYTWNSMVVTSLESSDLIGGATIDYVFVDSMGCQNTIAIPIQVNDTTTIDLNLTDQCMDGAAVNLNMISSNGPGMFITSYDGLSSDTVSVFDPSLIVGYPQVSTDYFVDYLYTNAAGCSSHTVDTITINPLPNVAFTVSDVCVNQEVVFTQQSSIGSGSIDVYQWVMAGIGSSDEAEPDSVSYVTFGQFSILLTAISDLGCAAQGSDTVVVHPQPTPVFSLQPVCLGQATIVNNNTTIPQGSINQISYQWGDTQSTDNMDAVVAHTYSDWGEYTIGVDVVSDFGCHQTDSLIATVFAVPEVDMLIENHCFGQQASGIDLSSIADGSIASISYNIPSENVDYTGSTFSHLFSDDGIFDVIHTVMSDQSCTVTDTISVTVYPLPIPAYTLADDVACARSEVVLIDQSMLPAPYTIDTVQWTLQGISSQGTPATFVFAEPGSVDVLQEVWSNVGCYAQLNQPASIVVAPRPYSDFIINPSELSLDENVAQFIDLSVGATSIVYQVGDDIQYEVSAPSHTFEEVGIYDVLQIVENDAGCIDSSLQHVRVVPRLIVFVPNAVTFDADGLNELFYPVISGDEVVEYELTIFDRGGTIAFHSTDPAEKWNGNVKRNHYYAQDGVYNWRLKISGKHTALDVYQGAVVVIR